MQMSKEDFLARANAASKNTLMETLEIEMVDFGDDFLVARMPVTPKVHQPDGVLHGGATAALAESVGSFASHIFIDTENLFVRGLEITANHLKSIREGFVYAKATFLHKGRTTQLLDIKVTDEADNVISICRLSTISLPKKK
ncbi:hotdog fold thioesterase [Winogradskyella sp. SYSU M77433]|uniref:PaaI family thioesterase n=1 Tax=Winogradskyella sp. SYSU M77433 TaxID=3042722 RepID=UPI002480B9D2|nr:hotdog fold thioesterase [Winogradskyella sp. SYSU M77433]MDH7912410.1 hotdog fold thioesterase [Winogradskyella sp. SYSU M77433]